MSGASNTNSSASQPGSLEACINFLNKAMPLETHCILNYGVNIDPNDIPSDIKPWVDQWVKGNINPNEPFTLKYQDPVEKQRRKHFADFLRQQYINHILQTIRDNHTQLVSKNATWKTKEAYYAMYRCGCKSTRVIFDKEEPKSDGAALKFPNVKCVFDAVKMWMSEYSGETFNFESKSSTSNSNIKNKKLLASQENKDTKIDQSKTSKYDSAAIIENVPHPEFSKQPDACPCYLSITFKLQAMELRIRLRHIKHRAEQIPSAKRSLEFKDSPQPKKTKKVSASPLSITELINDPLKLKTANNSPLVNPILVESGAELTNSSESLPLTNDKDEQQIQRIKLSQTSIEFLTQPKV
ncbi:hypothetical protein DAMA08_025340 [Martiniozyma asiatica (nom. inval.)]|nr:hypothetical protein DAMA08_025340 [Martiniozyma asiatica]